jgi:CRP/FNR family cyclic AMP-dependent transcriptional regulator
MTEADRIELMRAVSIFATLDDTELAGILKACRWTQVARGQVLIESTEPNTDIFFVARGAVSAKAFSTDGHEVMFAHISAGQIFGEFSAIDGKPRSATIEAIEPSLIASMHAGEFRGLLLKHPGLAVSLAEHLVSKLRGLSRRIFEYSTLPVKFRVHAELLRYCSTARLENGSAIIEPAPTHQEIATRISTHREAVSRELSQLAADGILQTSRRKIIVCDIDRLRLGLDPVLTD